MKLNTIQYFRVTIRRTCKALQTDWTNVKETPGNDLMFGNTCCRTANFLQRTKKEMYKLWELGNLWQNYPSLPEQHTGIKVTWKQKRTCCLPIKLYLQKLYLHSNRIPHANQWWKMLNKLKNITSLVVLAWFCF